MGDNPLRLRCKGCGHVSTAPGPDDPQRLIDHRCPRCGLRNFESVRDTPVCDFCCDERLAVVAAYPARTFNVPMPTDAFGANSRGRWAACAECALLIDRGHRDALAERSLDVFIAKGLGRGVPRPILGASIRSLHDQFWTNREGPKEAP